MKIAYVLPSLQQPTGWRRHACAFIKAISNYVKPVLFVAAADMEIARQLFPELPLHTLPVTQQASLGTRRGLKGLAATYWAIRRGSYPQVDLVHSLEAYPSGLVGSWLADRLRCPHAMTTHGTYGVVWHGQKLDRLVYERVLKKTRLVCPVSNGTARLMQQYFAAALAHTRLHPILNGNDYYKTVPRQVALERAVPPLPTLLSVGDVKPRKGQHVSLAAFARVKEQFPAARYLIAGRFWHNTYFRQLSRFISDHHLEDVNFLGAVSEADLRRYYQEASLFVLTPQQDGLHFEGFGLVYLEAGAYGLPVVATRSGGVPDAVQDGVTGLLAQPGNVAGVAEAIVRLLNDPELARRMGQANRQWAETLTWERNARQQYQAYQELLGA